MLCTGFFRVMIRREITTITMEKYPKYNLGSIAQSLRGVRGFVWCSTLYFSSVAHEYRLVLMGFKVFAHRPPETFEIFLSLFAGHVFVPICEELVLVHKKNCSRIVGILIMPGQRHSFKGTGLHAKPAINTPEHLDLVPVDNLCMIITFTGVNRDAPGRTNSRAQAAPHAPCRPVFFPCECMQPTETGEHFPLFLRVLPCYRLSEHHPEGQRHTLQNFKQKDLFCKIIYSHSSLLPFNYPTKNFTMEVTTILSSANGNSTFHPNAIS